MLRPAIFVALIFRTITAIQTFDIPYAMTGGGPGRFHRDARDVHPQDDARLPRLRLRLGAGGADVRAVDGRRRRATCATRGAAPARGGERGDASRSSAAPSSGSPRIVVAVNGFFPAVWILLTSLKTETELIRSPITYLPEAPTLANYDDGVHRAADPALHVEQLRRRVAVDGAVRAGRARSPPTR